MLNSFIKRGQIFFLLTFAGLILAGTLLVLIPGVYVREVSLLDALFTSTSAVCVTGLAVLPVHDFTIAGQLLILVLIQLGGLGIMTLSVSVLLGLGQHLSMGNQFLLHSLNDDFSLQGTEEMILMIVKYSFFCETLGAAIIYLGCLCNGQPPLLSLWESVFLAVSSYCNAGLSPYSDSMASTHWLSQLGSALTILSGSLGIYVIYDLVQRYRRHRQKLRLHTQVVLCATAVMVISGTLIFLFFGVGEQQTSAPLAVTALYTTIASSTAGFSTVDILELPDVGVACCMVLMLIGGAPGSTAGGVKISTIFLVLAGVWCTIKGNRDVVVFKRRIPPENVMRGFTILSLFLIMAGCGCLAIKIANGQLELDHLLFEAISAICTVGLSLGTTTAELSSAGKLVVIALMYIGRVGPFTLLLLLLGRTKSTALRYPDDRILLG